MPAPDRTEDFSTSTRRHLADARRLLVAGRGDNAVY